MSNRSAPDHTIIELRTRLVPDIVGAKEVRTVYNAFEQSQDRPQSEKLLHSEDIMLEDIHVCQMIQQAMRSPAFGVGAYATYYEDAPAAVPATYPVLCSATERGTGCGMKKRKWRTVLGLVLLYLAIVLNWQWIWGVLIALLGHSRLLLWSDLFLGTHLSSGKSDPLLAHCGDVVGMQCVSPERRFYFLGWTAECLFLNW